MAAFEALCEEARAVDERMRAPEVLRQNRGGILLKLQGEQKRLAKEVPRRAAELQRAFDAESSSTSSSSSPPTTSTATGFSTQPLTLFGMSFAEFADSIRGTATGDRRDRTSSRLSVRSDVSSSPAGAKGRKLTCDTRSTSKT